MTSTAVGTEQVLEILRRHAQHSSAALALNRDTEYFTVSDVDGVIAYRSAGRRHAVQIGSVFAPPEDQPRLLAAFQGWAREQRRRLCAVQLVRADLAHYAELGYRIGQLGASFSIKVASASVAGRKFERIRNKIARARRAGVTVTEVTGDGYDDSLARRLDELDVRWLAGKGRHVKQIEFMVGQRGRPGDRLHRLFVAWQQERPIAYVSYAPVFGAQAGWLYDLTRREPDSPPGVVELVFVAALQAFRQEGVDWLHLGFTPFCELSESHRPPASSLRTLEVLARLIADYGSWIYPARSQTQFKTKWQPTLVEPEYIGFHPSVTLPAIWRLLRLTRTI